MTQESYESMELLGMTADSLDNLAAGLGIPMPPEVHIAQMKVILPKLRDQLRQIYVTETGDNPWPL